VKTKDDLLDQAAREFRALHDALRGLNEGDLSAILPGTSPCGRKRMNATSTAPKTKSRIASTISARASRKRSTSGNPTNRAAPTNVPTRLAVPPSTTSATRKIERSSVKLNGLMNAW